MTGRQKPGSPVSAYLSTTLLEGPSVQFVHEVAPDAGVAGWRQRAQLLAGRLLDLEFVEQVAEVLQRRALSRVADPRREAGDLTRLEARRRAWSETVAVVRAFRRPRVL